jgi:hypothetical protein
MAPGILAEALGLAPCSPCRSNLSNISEQVQYWPPVLTGDLTWDASSFYTHVDYTHELTTQHKLEIHTALEYFKSLGRDGNEVNRQYFPLPTLGKMLLHYAEDLHHGKGFVNIRGLDPNHYSSEDNILLFLGISSYIGEKRAKQDDDGSMLMHISDAKSSRESQQNRPTRFSTRASTFHTDAFCDILALQTRNCAAKGGNHIIAASWTVYNKIAATRPDLLEVLARPNWPFDSRGRLFDCNKRPLLFYHGGRIILNFAREPLIGLDNVKRTEGFPVLSGEQREALDLIESLARESQLILDIQPGDLTFINNHALLHSREAFEVGPRATRYLVRMWLKNGELAWKLPYQLQMGNQRIYESNELEEKWNVVALPKLRFKLSERLCS